MKWRASALRHTNAKRPTWLAVLKHLALRVRIATVRSIAIATCDAQPPLTYNQTDEMNE